MTTDQPREGDRVRGRNVADSDTGTVIETDGHNAKVRWDIDGGMRWHPYEALERVAQIQATEHPNVHEAIQHLCVSADDRAISIGGRFFTVTEDEYQRIQLELSIQPTTWHDYQGKIMSVPGRHG